MESAPPTLRWGGPGACSRATHSGCGAPLSLQGGPLVPGTESVYVATGCGSGTFHVLPPPPDMWQEPGSQAAALPAPPHCPSPTAFQGEAVTRGLCLSPSGRLWRRLWLFSPGTSTVRKPKAAGFDNHAQALRKPRHHSRVPPLSPGSTHGTWSRARRLARPLQGLTPEAYRHRAVQEARLGPGRRLQPLHGPLLRDGGHSRVVHVEQPEAGHVDAAVPVELQVQSKQVLRGEKHGGGGELVPVSSLCRRRLPTPTVQGAELPHRLRPTVPDARGWEWRLHFASASSCLSCWSLHKPRKGTWLLASSMPLGPDCHVSEKL